MNILRPFAVVSAGSALQTAGLVCLSVAAGLVWGVVGGLTSAGVALVLVGVALERGE